MGYRKSIFIVFLLVSLVSSALGFGIASSYLPNNTLYISPGETKEYVIELQNTESIKMKTKLFLESNITKISNEKEFYFIGNDTPIQEINLVVTAPSDAKAGQEFIVKYGAYPLAQEGGTISLNLKINREFIVKIDEDSAKINANAIKNETRSNKDAAYSLALVMLLLIVLSIVFTMIIKKSHMFSKKVFK